MESWEEHHSNANVYHKKRLFLKRRKAITLPSSHSINHSAKTYAEPRHWCSKSKWAKDSRVQQNFIFKTSIPRYHFKPTNLISFWELRFFACFFRVEVWYLFFNCWSQLADEVLIISSIWYMDFNLLIWRYFNLVSFVFPKFNFFKLNLFCHRSNLFIIIRIRHYNWSWLFVSNSDPWFFNCFSTR